MNTVSPRAVWPLRPISAARGLEGTCWLAAAILAVALITGNRGAGASAPSVRATAAPPPQLSLRQSRCIERILSRAADRTEEELAARITADCFAGGRATFIASGSEPLSCARPFTVRVTPAANRSADCLGG
ncbi:MAG: hypothetical protein E6H90_09280 [Chloroflexi bacterium]|nr:MAG: hypothetical protein E6H90_09280 [Chloroflexota bacterium]